ncbi:enolase C-terminal domain-like protein [Gordonia sp. VNK21]|uniref:enolase C-terminal domain-like protein n=1 Tax=Gordonia sp. VNK21 TaxID=3382483 RepID=UPI0038D3E444
MKVTFDWTAATLEHPFVVSHTVVDTIETVRCTIDAGAYGVGRGVSTFGPWADTTVTSLRRGETVTAETLECLTTFVDVTDVTAFGARLRRSGEVPAGLRAAVEMAALDLVCQASELPLAEILGAPESAVLPILTTVSVGALDSATARGRLKVKVDNATVDLHLDRLAVLAEESELIVFDGNRSLDDSRFAALARAIAGRGQVYFEDPTATPATWATVAPSPDSVFIEDESVHCAADATSALRRGHGINIKALKFGGVLSARDCFEYARHTHPHQPRMVSCFVEEPEMIALSATVCGGYADIVDLDGHRILASTEAVTANAALEVNGSWVGLPILASS